MCVCVMCTEGKDFVKGVEGEVSNVRVCKEMSLFYSTSMQFAILQ